jgi:hypothetical protein
MEKILKRTKDARIVRCIVPHGGKDWIDEQIIANCE